MKNKIREILKKNARWQMDDVPYIELTYKKQEKLINDLNKLFEKTLKRKK